jgi:nitrate/TMAO reductase-like tetraheme cytochrome c subunit
VADEPHNREQPAPAGQPPASEPPAHDAPAGQPPAGGGGEGKQGSAGDGEGPRDGPLTAIRIPRAWLLGMIAAVVVALVVATVGFSIVNNDNTCGWCHVIKKEVASFKLSEHHREGVSCQDCHTKPGVFNYFIRNLQSATHIVENITGHYQRPLTTFVGTANCVQCHPKSQIEKDLIVGNIRVNHKGLREAGFQCVTCHEDVAHGVVIPVGSRPPESIMSICATCHNGVIQPKTCSICHLNGVPPGTVQIPIAVHMSQGNCRECHNSNFCAKCHNGLAMPHPAGWLKAHGPLVVDRGAKICASCHTDKHPKFCINCHGLPMPHPGNWLSSHPATAKSDPKVCVRCHGTDSCLKCHGVVLPHPASFIASHFTFAATQGSVCVKCHGNNDGGAASCYGGQCHAAGSPPH